MQIQPASAVSAQSQQAAAASSKKAKKEFPVGKLMNDITALKDKKPAHQAAIGILTLGSAIAGFRSTKGVVLKTISTMVMGLVGFAAGLGISDAVDKYLKNKPEKSADDKNKNAAPAKENIKPEAETTAKTEAKVEDKPVDKAEDKTEAKPEKKEKDDDKDDD